MYHSIKLENFRAFPLLEVTGLKRVNLFVGRNNAGKTSILEAIELLSLGGYPNALLRVPMRREEHIYTIEERSRPEVRTLDVDIRHLFTGHRLEGNAWFQVSGLRNGIEKFFKCDIILDADLFDQRLALKLIGSEIEDKIIMPLSERGIIVDRLTMMRADRPPMMRASSANITPTYFLGAENASQPLGTLWSDIVLTAEEENIYEILRSMAPDLERIAFTETERRGSVAFVKLKGSDRFPLGNLGDGIRRLLKIAVFLVKSANGYLLIDEIDTGLHYSTMEEMWRFVIQTAERLNIQVFATTHSGDCLRALAWLQQDQPDLADQVTLHRIEASLTKSVRYSAEELEIAARHHIEVRG